MPAAGRLRIYDAGRVEPRQIASGRFENSSTGEVIGHITAIRVSPDGIRLALLSQRVVRAAAGGVAASGTAAAPSSAPGASGPGAAAASGGSSGEEGIRFPDASVYSYCGDTDTLSRYQVGPRKCPVHVAWDAYEPRLLAVQTERLRISDEDRDAGGGGEGGESGEAEAATAAGGSTTRRSGSVSEGKEADEPTDGSAAGVLRSARSTSSGGSDAAAAAAAAAGGKPGASGTPGASAALSTGRSLSALLAADEPDAEVLMLFATADSVGGSGDASASGGAGPDGRPASAASTGRIATGGASASGGLVPTDVFTLEAPTAACLVGVCTPYVHLLASGMSSASTGGSAVAGSSSTIGGSSTRLLHRTMRDFSGMEAADEATKRALTDFGYHMATGNMDDAYRSVKVSAGHRRRRASRACRRQRCLVRSSFSSLSWSRAGRRVAGRVGEHGPHVRQDAAVGHRRRLLGAHGPRAGCEGHARDKARAGARGERRAARHPAGDAGRRGTLVHCLRSV